MSVKKITRAQDSSDLAISIGQPGRKKRRRGEMRGYALVWIWQDGKTAAEELRNGPAKRSRFGITGGYQLPPGL